MLQGYYLFTLLLLSILSIKPTWEKLTNHKLSHVPCDLYLLQSALQLSLFLPRTVTEQAKYFVPGFFYIHKMISLALGPQHKLSSITVFYLFRLDLKGSACFLFSTLPHQFFLSFHSCVGTISSWYQKLIICCILVSTLQNAEAPCNTIAPGKYR